MNACLAKLYRLRDQFNEILNLLGQKHSLRGEEKAKAQELLKALKGQLRNEYKFGSTLKGEKKMTQVEIAYYFPAVQDALNNIYVKTNSVPNGRWRSDLFSALGQIEFFIRQLESQMK